MQADPGPVSCVWGDGSEMGSRQGLEGAFMAEIEVKCSCCVALGKEDKGGMRRERQETGREEAGAHCVSSRGRVTQSS